MTGCAVSDVCCTALCQGFVAEAAADCGADAKTRKTLFQTTRAGAEADYTQLLSDKMAELTPAAIASEENAKGAESRFCSNRTTDRMLLYPPKSEFISDFWRETYEKESSKNWNRFYQRNENRFFKDRHYLDKEWGHFFVSTADESTSDESRAKKTRVILEVGCGVGNTIFPLISDYPNLYIHACDFASRAVDLVKAHPEYSDGRVNAFVCDVTSDDLSSTISAMTVDVVTLVFMLSAVSPEKMTCVLQNIKTVLKPGGFVLVRDYAAGDLAEERLKKKRNQKISDNFFVRGDGTRSYYFTQEMLTSLFLKEGFSCEEMKVHCRSVENRAREIVMHRRWIQGAFRLNLSEGQQPNLSSMNVVTAAQLF